MKPLQLCFVPLPWPHTFTNSIIFTLQHWPPLKTTSFLCFQIVHSVANQTFDHIKFYYIFVWWGLGFIFDLPSPDYGEWFSHPFQHLRSLFNLLPNSSTFVIYVEELQCQLVKRRKAMHCEKLSGVLTCSLFLNDRLKTNTCSYFLLIFMWHALSFFNLWKS